MLSDDIKDKLVENKYIEETLNRFFLKKLDEDDYCYVDTNLVEENKSTLKKRSSDDIKKILEEKNPENWEELIKRLEKINDVNVKSMHDVDAKSILYLINHIKDVESLSNLLCWIIDKKKTYQITEDKNFIYKSNIKIKEITLNKLKDFISDWNNRSNAIRIYRGHSNLNYLCIPFLLRNESWKRNFNEMQRELFWLCPKEFMNIDRTDIIAKMQHYGLPTRMLDFTTNPLVALYFACEDEKGIGEIIVCDVRNCCDTVDDVKDIGILRPKFPNARIQAQEGLFVYGDTDDELQFIEKINDIRIKNDNKKIVYYIKNKEKKKIKKRLELYGITEAKLFPELSNVINYIKDKYG